MLSRSADGRRHLLDRSTQIFNHESRLYLLPLAYPWWSICKLKFWTRVSDTAPWMLAGESTGFMAGRSVCVTASHCFPKGTFAGWKIDVIPGMFGGVSYHGPGAVTNVHSTLRVPSYQAGSDIMVMGLYDPVGEITGWFGTAVYDDDWEDDNRWTLSGYCWDFDPYASLEQEIAVYDDDYGPSVTLPNGDWWESLQIETYADAASGLSGAPLFGWFDDGLPSVIGVHRGREYDWEADANSVASGGRLLKAMVGWAQKAWN
jgi:hypothetical protein